VDAPANPAQSRQFTSPRSMALVASPARFNPSRSPIIPFASRIYRDEDSRVIGSLDARRLPREAQERTRNGADATAERRWENEGGRLPVEHPREDLAGSREPQPQMSRD
jgi:hypothetical protein